MTQLFLSEPTLQLRESYLAFYQDLKNSGEHMVPWVISKDPTDFQAMIQSLVESALGEKLPITLVSSSTYWLINEEQQVLCAVNIRHRLHEKLLNCGGQCGKKILVHYGKITQ